jgi:hypothetical protein
MRLSFVSALLVLVGSVWISACSGSDGGDAPGGSGGGPPSGSGGSMHWTAGNPNGSCTSGVPTEGRPADSSTPTTVVGTGTAASCTFAALQAAVAKAGVITFSCGSDPVTIAVTATLTVPSNKDTVIDGGNKVTLDGGGAVQILRFVSDNFQANDRRLTLQHITFTRGKATPTEKIPTAPEPCSQGWNDGEGGALFMRDGNLTIVDAVFTDNHAAPLGPDTGGGAIYVLGSKGGAFIVGSTFANNSAANAGAVGGLFTELNIYDSLFMGNAAVGHGANYDDPDKCDARNNGQNEVGSGGNGGAIYSDGNDVDITLCGSAVLNNDAGDEAFGGGIFFTSNNFGGVLTIKDSTITGNTGGSWTQVQSGSMKNAGSAVGTNCKSLTIANSTVQGVP